MSPLLAPDLSQIERALDTLLDRHPDARVLGLRSPVKRAWPDLVERRGRRFRLSWCDSELQLRECLDAAEDDGGEGAILLTPLDGSRLSGDVLMRLPRARLEQTDRWTALRAAFQARDIDPRLRGQGWLADLLLERAPPVGYPPAPGAMLDLETAWQTLWEKVLQLPEGRADGVALLQWTLDPVRLQQFLTLPDQARIAVTEHVVDPAGMVVLRSARSGRGADALAIGLVCGVLFADDVMRPDLRDAAVRLEPALGNTAIAPDAGRALAMAARNVLKDLFANDPATARTAQAQASTLLSEIRADAFAALSPALEVGLEARIRDAGMALGAATTAGTMDEAHRAWNLVRQAREHDRAPEQQGRIDRLTMAARLSMWLAGRRQPAPVSFQAACLAYAQDRAFVDRARSACRSGDPISEVAAAYAQQRALATQRREAENQAFATMLAQWNSAGSFGTEPYPIERLLEQVAVPIGREAPLLVLVLDGLSVSIWRDLADSIARLGWFEMWPVGRSAPPVAVATMPSVTEISRASLLCGTLTRGDQGSERTGFAAHPGLFGISRAGKPPRLFHKADLGGGPELEPAVRDALVDPQQHVVGIVHNAVDAQLSGSDQIDINWSTESLRQVLSVLRFARDANRIVLVVADHGHVIEAGTRQNGSWGSDRWRAPGPAGTGEIAMAGGRVVSPGGGNAIVAAWSEQVRYSSKRAGYHGGVSPQEMLIPIGVLGARQTTPAGWDRAPPSEPSWWRGLDELAVNAVAEKHSAPGFAPVPRPRQADQRQSELFVAPVVTAATELAAAVPVPGAPAPPAWIADLIGSESYAVQRRLAGRGAPTDEQVAAVLVALSTRGGRLSRATLAQTMALPLLRVGGVVSASRRVLNLDQAQVLREEGDEVVFNELLARTQFGLGNP